MPTAPGASLVGPVLTFVACSERLLPWRLSCFLALVVFFFSTLPYWLHHRWVCLEYLPVPLCIFLGEFIWYFVVVGALPAASCRHVGAEVLRANFGCLGGFLLHGVCCVGCPGPGLFLGGVVGRGFLFGRFADCPDVLGKEGVRFVDL